MIEALRRQENFEGAAVTIPHKIELAKLCDELGETAQLTGAVNAIMFHPDRRLLGDTLMARGSLPGSMVKGFPQDKKILMVGAGKARAVGLAWQRSRWPGSIFAIARRTRPSIGRAACLG